MPFDEQRYQLTNGKILDNSVVYVQLARPRLCLKTWSAFQSAHNQYTNRREELIRYSTLPIAVPMHR